MHKLLYFLLIITIPLYAVSCVSQTPTPTSIPTDTPAPPTPTVVPATNTIAPTASPTVTVTPEAAYPAPEQPAYPPPPTSDQASSAYPAPSPIPTLFIDLEDERPFSINEPLEKGMTKVYGTGPKNVDITIVDATYMGQVLGEGTIGADGTFQIDVAPLRETHRVGIMLKTETDDIAQKLAPLRGPGAISMPQIGNLWASAMVQE